MTDKSAELQDWLIRISGPEWSWFAKRLSANDTGLTGGHQAGFHVPRNFAMAVAPELLGSLANPRRRLSFQMVSHGQISEPRLIYYNSYVFLRQANGRNEFRVTGFGGKQSVLQDPQSTGAILVTAWAATGSRVEAWVAETPDEEEAIEGVLGPVEPATQILRIRSDSGQLQLLVTAPISCDPDIAELPPAWAARFPPGRELTEEAVSRRLGIGETVDTRLISRYRCEFGLFKVVEAIHTMPLIIDGFPTVDEFLAIAQTVANRRKSRAGRSLELHLAKLFDEESVRYETGATTEGNRKPDFVFPSIADYRAGRATRMLGVKTSVKDRWRQVLDEAAGIREKHLFTLSEGVSPDQFHQMEGAGLRLVVPRSNVKSFPEAFRKRLLTLAEFINLVR
jgi:hypothetical protein